MIERKGLKDLVNRGNKVGNSWPVLNAGEAPEAVVPRGPRGKAEPIGEAVVYSSFIARMR
jgi:hypothetical protein